MVRASGPARLIERLVRGIGARTDCLAAGTGRPGNGAIGACSFESSPRYVDVPAEQRVDRCGRSPRIFTSRTARAWRSAARARADVGSPRQVRQYVGQFAPRGSRAERDAQEDHDRDDYHTAQPSVVRPASSSPVVDDARDDEQLEHQARHNREGHRSRRS